MNPNQLKELVRPIKLKLEMHHSLYRLPCKAEQWEDIFDQVINPLTSNWVGGGHSSGHDVMSESDGLLPKNIRIQNKSGCLNLKKGTLEWNGHRTTTHKTLEDKIKFISEDHYDYYAMLSRDKKDWKLGKKIYYLSIFNSNKIDYSTLNWSEKYSSKTDKLSGWVGVGNDNYSAKIVKTMSDQLWTSMNLSYIDNLHKIEIV